MTDTAPVQKQKRPLFVYCPSLGEVNKLKEFNCVWSNLKLGQQHYRLMWWMIDAGMMKKEAKIGWYRLAAKFLGVRPLTVANRVNFLIEQGALLKTGKGSVRFNPAFFESRVPEGIVKFKKVKGPRKVRVVEGPTKVDTGVRP